MVRLDVALRLPAPDVHALTEGRTVAAIFPTYFKPGRVFALAPTQADISLTDIPWFYDEHFVSIAQKVMDGLQPEQTTILSWARFTSCQNITDDRELGKIANLMPWTEKALKHTFDIKGQLFLGILRVYELGNPFNITIPQIPEISKKKPPIPFAPKEVKEDNPILSESFFSQRVEQIIALKPALHGELEKLESSVDGLTGSNINAVSLKHEIRSILGWKSNPPTLPPKISESWIHDIAALGDRSKEEDQGKNNFQAGTDFEIAVRKSLEFLGFTIDYCHKGGAGGLDLCCSQPYTIVGECKSGKKIPNDTAVQLLNLGTLRLEDKQTFSESVKLIIGPGSPTSQLEKAAKVHGMAIINPQTLENLVKLYQKYPGSVDLFKLKDYLVDGRADDEVDKYIDTAKLKIQLRATIVQQVKQYLDEAKAEAANLDALHAVYLVSKPSQKLARKEFHEILIELSSPLAGYLGRQKGEDGCDRFYFLRDLVVE